MILGKGFARECIEAITMEYVQHVFADNPTNHTTYEQMYPDVDALTYTSASPQNPLDTSCSKGGEGGKGGRGG
jgi:hypothetical protein